MVESTAVGESIVTESSEAPELRVFLFLLFLLKDAVTALAWASLHQFKAAKLLSHFSRVRLCVTP